MIRLSALPKLYLGFAREPDLLPTNRCVCAAPVDTAIARSTFVPAECSWRHIYMNFAMDSEAIFSA